MLVDLIKNLQNPQIQQKQISIDPKTKNKKIDYNNIPAYKKLTQIYHENLRKNELFIIAKPISEKTGIKIGRDIKRSKPLLIQWFDDNWDEIEPYLKTLITIYADDES